jgi:peptidoglycan/xylan/chitin deacetylase (PgdA/CDA1 family)
MTQGQLPILTFHAIEDRREPISFPSRLFERLTATLTERGYRTVHLLEAVYGVRRGELGLDRSLVLTFDDGFASVYERAFPILRRLDMSATVFLTVGERPRASPTHRLPSFLGRPMLSWSEIREMSRYGITFGAHTLTHPDLTRLPLHRVRTEVAESKAAIEDALGREVTSFAYPFGRSSRAVRSVVEPLFRCACSDELGFLSSRSHPYEIARIDTYYLRSERLLDLTTRPTLRRPLRWYLATRGALRRMRRRVAGLSTNDS